MKTRIAAMVFLALCLLSSAAMGQLRLITPETADRYGCIVQVVDGEEMIAFTVSGGAGWDTNSLGKAGAMLVVNKDFTTLATVTLSPILDEGRPCYKFTLTRDVAKESTLELPAKPTRAGRFRVKLGEFLTEHIKRKVPQPSSAGDAANRAAPEK